MNKGLTKRQSDILHFIGRKIKSDKIPPSIKEICNEFGFSSTNGVAQVLAALEKKGYISRTQKGKSRCIIINDRIGNYALTSMNDAPPVRYLNIISNENVTDSISLLLSSKGKIIVDSNLFPEGKNLFVALVHEESLSNSGLFVGDYAIFELNSAPNHEDIVLALIYEQVVIRKFLQNGDFHELRATNKGFPTIKFSKDDKSVVLVGVLKGVVRKL